MWRCKAFLVWTCDLLRARDLPHLSMLHTLCTHCLMGAHWRYLRVWICMVCTLLYIHISFFNSLNRINLSAHNCSRIATYAMRHCDKGTSFIVAPTHHISRSEESALPKNRGVKSILGIALPLRRCRYRLCQKRTSTGLIAHAQLGGSGSSSGGTALLWARNIRFSWSRNVDCCCCCCVYIFANGLRLSRKKN